MADRCTTCTYFKPKESKYGICSKLTKIVLDENNCSEFSSIDTMELKESKKLVIRNGIKTYD